MRILLTVLWLLTAGFAQTTNPSAASARPLKILDTLTLDYQSPGTLLGKMQCDSSGNIYFNELTDTFGPVVGKIDVSEKKIKSYSWSKAGPGIWRGAFAFAVSPSGEIGTIAALRKNPKEASVNHYIKFDRDGDVSVNEEISDRFSVSQMALFPSGEFLASGKKEIANPDGTVNIEPYTVLFSSRGRLIKTVGFAADEEVSSKLKNMELGTLWKGGSPVRSLDLSVFQVAEDGTAYLMRYTTPASIYVIASDGRVLRTLKVDPPNPGDVLSNSMLSKAGLPYVLPAPAIVPSR